MAAVFLDVKTCGADPSELRTEQIWSVCFCGKIMFVFKNIFIFNTYARYCIYTSKPV